MQRTPSRSARGSPVALCAFESMTRRVAMFCFALLCVPAATALETLVLPFDYIRPVKGGKHIFVMLRPKEQRKNTRDYSVFSDSSSWRSTPVDGLLFRRYPTSGLYRRGSNKPLWTVDWYSLDVRACSDGVHLVRFGPPALFTADGKTLAVAFYRSGKKIRSYAVRDLIRNYKELPRTMSSYQWMKSNGFDDVGKRLRIEVFRGHNNASGRTMLFDITTGLRLSARPGYNSQYDPVCSVS